MNRLLNLFVVALLLTVAASCKKDDPKPAPGKDDSQKVEVTGVTLNKTTLSLEIGKEETLTATVAPENATDKAVTWSSSKTDIATVDGNGKVKAVAAGETTITATSKNGKTATCSVTVTNETIAVTSISLNKTALSLKVGESETLVATVTPENATETLIWEADCLNGEFSVDQNGKVTALKAGEGYIIVRNQDYTIYATGGVEVTDDFSAGDTKTINGIECAFIPSGSFYMGSPSNEYNRYDDEAQHLVELSQSFWMSKYEITISDYCEFLNDLDLADLDYEEKEDQFGKYTEFNMNVDGYGKQLLADADILWDNSLNKWVPLEGKIYFPINYVTWYGAVAYTNWMSEKSGYNCSLPTEAQWEYACRGGVAAKPFGIGDGSKLVYGMANFRPEYPYDLEKEGEYIYSSHYEWPKNTKEVGVYLYANGFGLYDMHGNVSEWCLDWYETQNYIPNEILTDPQGPSTGEDKVLRGGDHISRAKNCRSAFRGYAVPDDVQSSIGFRVIFEAK